MYGASVSKETISTITDRVMDGLSEWQSRPLDPVYAVVFVDAIRVKIRDGHVANRPVYLAMGVTVDGERDMLGLWAGEHGDGEGAKFWLRVCPRSRAGASVTCYARLRRAQRAARCGEHGVGQDHRANLRGPSFAQLVQVHLQAGLGGDRPRPQAGVYRLV